MKKYFKCILIPAFLIQLGCAKDEEPDNVGNFRSQFTLETEDTTILSIEIDPIPFASTF